MKIGAGKPGRSTSIWTRDRIKRYLVQRFYTRFHMTLILMSSGLAAMLGNWVQLHAIGVSAMWVRYPIAVGLAYGTFLCGIWLWLRYVGLRPAADASASSFDGGDMADVSLGDLGGSAGGSGSDLPDLRVGGGGGQFGGGGASASWADAGAVQGSGGGGSSGSSFGLGGLGDLDADGIILLILALALFAAIFLASGYVIWFAPDILSEAVFGATLAAGLARSAGKQDNEGWVAGVIKKTWWPFAIVLVLAEAVAIFAALNFPKASTLGQALTMALE